MDKANELANALCLCACCLMPSLHVLGDGSNKLRILRIFALARFIEFEVDSSPEKLFPIRFPAIFRKKNL